MYEEVLAKRWVILGNEHPSTLITMNNLAGTYRHQGKSTEAAKMYEKVLAKFKMILGDEHPSMFTTRSSKAFLKAMREVLSSVCEKRIEFLSRRWSRNLTEADVPLCFLQCLQ